MMKKSQNREEQTWAAGNSRRRPMAPILWQAALAGLWLAGFSGCAGRPAVKEFDPSAHKGATAVIAFPQKFDGELLVSDFKSPAVLSARCSGGKATVPAGRIQLLEYAAKKAGARNEPWEARGSIARWVTLQPDATCEVEAGPPFQTAIRVSKSSSGADILSLSLTDAGGKNVAFLKSSVRVSPPGFEILNEAGQAVFTGKFEYG